MEEICEKLKKPVISSAKQEAHLCQEVLEKYKADGMERAIAECTEWLAKLNHKHRKRWVKYKEEDRQRRIQREELLVEIAANKEKNRDRSQMLKGQLVEVQARLRERERLVYLGLF